MRALLVLASVCAAGVGAAGERTFGTDFTCEIYAEGGAAAINQDSERAANDGLNYLIVTPTNVYGLEWQCAIGQYSGDQAALTCAGEGEEWASSATIFEDDEGLVFSFSDENGTAYLRRC